MPPPFSISLLFFIDCLWRKKRWKLFLFFVCLFVTGEFNCIILLTDSEPIKKTTIGTLSAKPNDNKTTSQSVCDPLSCFQYTSYFFFLFVATSLCIWDVVVFTTRMCQPNGNECLRHTIKMHKHNDL